MRRELDELKSFLRQRGITFEKETVQGGTQLICPRGGEKITHYSSSGRVVVRGTRTELGSAIEAWAKGEAFEEGAEQVFIVYGHDIQARKDLELILRQMGFDPIVLGDRPARGATIIEKLEEHLGPCSDVTFAFVLLTPDDVGHAEGDWDNKRPRARQNVILELGWVLGRLGRKHVVILHKGSVELPSDSAGLLYIPFEEQVDEAKGRLFQELVASGYQPKVVH